MKTTLIILDENLEKIAKVLKQKHVELLGFIFGGHSSRFNIADPKSSSKGNNEVLRVIITFSIKNFKYGFRKYQLNIKLSKNYLVFSIHLDEQLKNILEDDLDLLKIFLEIGLQVKSKTIADHPSKKGINGQHHSTPNHVSNGFGKLPRKKRISSGKIPRKKKKNKKKK